MSEKLATGQQAIEDRQDNVQSVVYTANEAKSLAFYTTRCTEAKSQRDQIYREFDDTSYEVDYELGEQAKNSYLRRKMNDDEVRVNTGTTEKKIEAVQNELLSMNMQPEVLAFDKEDNELTELGVEVTDLVKRTNEIERDDDFWIEATQELLCQRAVFIEELFTEKEFKNKKKISGILGRAGYKFERTDNTSVARAVKRVLSGLQVYLGDITIPAYLFNEQPYIVKYERMSYDRARAIYGSWKNWKFIQPGMGTTDWMQGTYKYRMGILRGNEVEILKYESYPDDEYQIIINGVMMLDVASPLPWEREGYNTTMTVLKPMRRDFAYGRALTSSAKHLQALDNETIRLLIRKFRQAIEPPLGVAGSTVYSKDIWSPGAVTQGVGKDTFARLIDHDGVTTSEFAMYDLIKKQTEEFVGASNVLQGVQAGRKQSATEIMTLYRQAVKMLGFSVLGYTRMKRDCTYMRVDNLLENYTKPIGKQLDPLTKEVTEIYQKFTVKDGKYNNGKLGKKVIQFMGRDLAPQEEQQIYDHETEQESIGDTVRITTINVSKLRSIPIIFYVTVIPQEKESSSLHKVMFQDWMSQAVGITQITGRRLNADKVVEDFERTWSKRDMFEKPMPQQGMDMGQGQDAQDPQATKDAAQQILGDLGQLETSGTDMGGMMKQGAATRPERPSLNTLANGQQPA